MVATQRKISTAQLFTVIFVLGMSLKMLMLPVLLLKACGRDSVIAMAIVLVMELLCLSAMLAAVLLAPNKRFAELLADCFGKWASKGILLVMAVFFFAKLTLLSGEVRIFFTENLFKEFAWGVYSLPFFALCALFGMGATRSVGRAVQFLFPFIAIASLVMSALICRGVEFWEVLPIGGYGIKNVSAETTRYAMWYGDYSALAVFLGAVKRNRKTALWGSIAGISVSAVPMLFMLGLSAAFSNVCYLIRFGQNVTGMTQYALGNTVQGRFDLLLFCVWLLSAFLKAGIVSYAAVYCLCAVFPAKPPLTAWLLGLILYIVSICFPSATGLHTFMIRFMAIPALVWQFAVPALSVFAAARYRRKIEKRRKTVRRAAAAKGDDYGAE